MVVSRRAEVVCGCVDAVVVVACRSASKPKEGEVRTEIEGYSWHNTRSRSTTKRKTCKLESTKPEHILSCLGTCRSLTLTDEASWRVNTNLRRVARQCINQTFIYVGAVSWLSGVVIAMLARTLE